MQYRLACLAAASFVVAGILWISPPARAAATLSPQAMTEKECGACHMVFPPEFLPARSWTKLMGGLENHFGETATLNAATTRQVTDFLVMHAGDAPGENPHALRGLAANVTPLRITETPSWVREHREASAAAFTGPKVKSKANCVACHKGAVQGIYNDEGGERGEAGERDDD